MAKPLDKDFVVKIRAKLNEQLSAFELAKKKKEHDARIVSEEGRKKWHELKQCVKSYIEEINDGLREPLLSYSDNASPNALGLKNELSDCDIQIAFDPAAAAISYQSKKAKGEFRPRVRGDVLDYEWDETMPLSTPRPRRKISLDEDGEAPASEDKAPVLFPAGRMSQIILRHVVS
jgi:hypothetical protein